MDFFKELRSVNFDLVILYIILNDSLSFRIIMVANTKQSYDVPIECMIMDTTTKSTNSLDLKLSSQKRKKTKPTKKYFSDNEK